MQFIASKPVSREAMRFGLMAAGVLNASVGSLIVLIGLSGNFEAAADHQFSVSGAALLGLAFACLCAERAATWAAHGGSRSKN